MPIYRWLNKETNEIVEVLRSFEDYLTPPSEDENWQKLVDAPAGLMSPEGGNKRFTDRKVLLTLEKEIKNQEVQGNMAEAKKLKQETKKVGKL
jgi:hypothetical protein